MGGLEGGRVGRGGREGDSATTVVIVMQTKMAAQDETKSVLAREYLVKIEQELKHTCKEVLVQYS